MGIVTQVAVVALVVVGLAFFAHFFEALMNAIRGPQSPDGLPVPDNTPFERTSAREIGVIVGLMGGDHANGHIIARVVEEFETKHRRKATRAEITTMAAMHRSMGF